MVAWTSDFGSERRPTTTVSELMAQRPARLGIDGRPVPFLRGRLHQFAVLPAAIAGVVLMGLADGLRPRVSLGIFTVSIVAMLTASAVYHCHSHTPSARLHARRVDHGTIFVAIAGTQTAYWMLVGPDVVAVPMIAIVWTLTAFAFRHKLRHLSTANSTGNWMFGALGWSGTILLPWLAATGVVTLGLVMAGGAAYSIGGLLLHRKWGEIWPGVAGHHEVWHGLVLLGVLLHGIGIVGLTGAVG